MAVDKDLVMLFFGRRKASAIEEGLRERVALLAWGTSLWKM
jgi:hypothetical protein